MTKVAPIRRSIEVKAPAESAFALFTAHIGAWWPLERHSVYGAGSLVAFEGDRLVERSRDGESVWAEVVEWDPPRGLRLAWHAGQDSTRATDLTITFEPLDGVTLITLVHGGWERTEHPAEAAEEYGNGWPTVLDRFAGRVSAFEALGSGADDDTGDPGADDDTDAWYALVHSPGPAVGPGESVFSHPLFGEHVAFIQRLRDQGLLIAAGPVVPQRGEGMTLVRVDAARRGEVDVHELATRDDVSVRDGLLVVEVRPWDVRFTA
jgi:uncharacterized protein YndB with AHSA1/START domain/uncharacterized protein YciI